MDEEKSLASIISEDDAAEMENNSVSNYAMSPRTQGTGDGSDYSYSFDEDSDHSDHSSKKIKSFQNRRMDLRSKQQQQPSSSSSSSRLLQQKNTSTTSKLGMDTVSARKQLILEEISNEVVQLRNQQREVLRMRLQVAKENHKL